MGLYGLDFFIILCYSVGVRLRREEMKAKGNETKAKVENNEIKKEKFDKIKKVCYTDYRKIERGNLKLNKRGVRIKVICFRSAPWRWNKVNCFLFLSQM